MNDRVSQERSLGTKESDTPQDTKEALRNSALVAISAVALSFTWLFLATHYLYGNNWTSVYYTGDRMPVPEELAKEHVYRFDTPVGYDGQAYHIVAHDPLFRRGLDRSVDIPRIRYRRILVPGLAALLSLGHGNWVDPAFIFVILAFVFLGTFWLCRISTAHGRSALWGFLFLASPAALSSVLVMVIDVSLAALTVGFVFYSDGKRSNRKLFAVLACAGLARETGVLLVAAYCVWLLYKRRLLSVLLFAVAAVPALLWTVFVHLHTQASEPSWISPIPFLGLFHSFAGWSLYRPGLGGHLLLALDQLARLGVVFAVAFTLLNLFRRRDHSPPQFVALAFSVLAIFLAGGEVWADVLSFGRNFTPLLLIVAITGILRSNWASLLPTFMVSTRIAAIYAVHAAKIASSIVHPR